jgi:FAD-dependent urate hydroxylase
MLMGDTVVVGAGPYGLSIAAHLRAAGLGVRVFGDLMASWRRHMPAGMYLKSTPDASSLSAPGPGSTIFDYCAQIGSEVLTKEDAIPIDVFIDYGLWFADRHIPDVEADTVVAVSRAGRDFDVQLASGEELRTASVVVACGVIPYAYTPPELLPLAPAGPAPDSVLSHTAQHAELSGARRSWPSPEPRCTCWCAHRGCSGETFPTQIPPRGCIAWRSRHPRSVRAGRRAA